MVAISSFILISSGDSNHVFFQSQSPTLRVTLAPIALSMYSAGLTFNGQCAPWWPEQPWNHDWFHWSKQFCQLFQVGVSDPSPINRTYNIPHLCSTVYIVMLLQNLRLFKLSQYWSNFLDNLQIACCTTWEKKTHECRYIIIPWFNVQL